MGFGTSRWDSGRFSMGLLGHTVRLLKALDKNSVLWTCNSTTDQPSQDGIRIANMGFGFGHSSAPKPRWDSIQILNITCLL